MVGMERFVSLVAPRSRLDFAFKWLGFLLAINVMNMAVEVGILGYSYDLRREMVIILLVGGPFIVLALGIMGHQRNLQNRLADLAATDMLTGIRNRRAFMFDTMAALDRSGGGVLLVVDADYFKRVNDSYGHAVGDICLQAIAARLREVVRAQDIVGRLGGEEFGIYLHGATAELALSIGQRICDGILLDAGAAPVELTDSLHLTLSAGASITRPGEPIEKALSEADLALYRAKAAGRARIEFWHPRGAEKGAERGIDPTPVSAPNAA